MAALVLTHSVTGCDVTIEADVSTTEADSVIELLHAHHLGAFKRPHPRAVGKTTFDVAVLPHEAAEAVSVLRAAGTTDIASEPQRLDHRKRVPTVFDEQEEAAATSARELERMIGLWDGVISTRVRITPAIEAARPLGSQPAPVHATVVVKHQPGKAPAAITVQVLVGNAVPGIRAEDVFVVLLEGRHTTPSPLVQLGPIAVTRGSAEILRLGLIATLSLLALCAILLAWTRVRASRTKATG